MEKTPTVRGAAPARARLCPGPTRSNGPGSCPWALASPASSKALRPVAREQLMGIEMGSEGLEMMCIHSNDPTHDPF